MFAELGRVRTSFEMLFKALNLRSGYQRSPLGAERPRYLTLTSKLAISVLPRASHDHAIPGWHEHG